MKLIKYIIEKRRYINTMNLSCQLSIISENNPFYYCHVIIAVLKNSLFLSIPKDINSLWKIVKWSCMLMKRRYFYHNRCMNRQWQLKLRRNDPVDVYRYASSLNFIRGSGKARPGVREKPWILGFARVIRIDTCN